MDYSDIKPVTPEDIKEFKNLVRAEKAISTIYNIPPLIVEAITRCIEWTDNPAEMVNEARP